MSLDKLYTIEVNDAVGRDTECPFCELEAMLERQALEFTLGSSYMESDVREQTAEQGFCRDHMMKMYRFGNALGNAWILKSRMEVLRKEYQTVGTDAKKGGLTGMLQKMRGKSSSSTGITYQEDTCFVCARIRKNKIQMMESFLYLLVNDKEFPELISHSKGFCLRHFPELLDVAERKLSQREKEQILPLLMDTMNRNLDRIQEDIDWFIEKYDYRNENEPWKNSKDAVQRTIQKINGIMPEV